MSMYGTTKYIKLFDDEITNFLIYEAGLKHSQCQISIY